MVSFKEKYIDVLSIIRASLFGDEIGFTGIDYDFVYQEMTDQAILPISAGLYKKLPLEPDLMSRWHNSLLQQIAQGAMVRNVEYKLTLLFDENNIDSVILKGASAAQYYHYGVMRAFGDVDIIVNPSDFEKAAALMIQNDYTQLTGLYDDYRNVTFSINGIEVELHRHFFIDDFTRFDELIYEALPHCYKRSVLGHTINVLPDIENGLVLLEHIRQHIVGELGFRQIIDWLMFVDRICSDSFWNESFKHRVEEIGLTKLAVTVTALGKKYLGLSDKITWCDSAKSEAIDALMAF